MKRLIRGRVNIGQPSYTPLAYVNQLDDITLELDIYNGNSPLDVTGQTVSLYAKRSNTTVVEQLSGLSTASTKVTGDVKNSCFAVPGITEMQLEFTDSTGKTTVSSFYINVNKSLSSEDSITAGNEIAILTEAKKMEPIRQENERGRVEAEKLRVQSETDRAAAETARVEAEELRVTAEAGREKRLSDVEEKATNNATQIADIVKYQANSNKDYECKEHDTLDSRLQADYAMMMDRFNKASLLPYEAEFITASNSYEGKTRDNVIKGRTLQNLWTNNANKTFNPLYIYSTVTQQNILNKLLLKPSTLYSLIILSNVENKINVMYFGSSKDTSNCFIPKATSFSKVKTFTTPSTIDVTDYGVFVYSKHETPFIESDISNIKFMLLEGDYTNKIPPYFEGIKSVNEDGENLEEVSCGKNLFDYSKYTLLGGATLNDLVNGFIVEGSNGGSFVRIPIRVKKNTDYIFSFSHELLANAARKFVSIFKSNGVIFKYNIDTPISFNTGSEEELFFCFYAEGTSSARASVKYLDIQLEEGTVSTSYESYTEDRLPIKMKNLRSLPNGICDTSDGVRRIGKIVLDGVNENLNYALLTTRDTTAVFSISGVDKKKGDVNFISDRFITMPQFTANIENMNGRVDTNTLVLEILKSRISAPDISSLKTWLQSNPTTVYYELATPTKEEGNVEQLRTYDGTTNIFTEGSLINPTISCKVPSNVQAVVMNLREENQTLNNDVNTLQATTEENNLMNIETNVNQEARLTMLELGVI